MAVLESGEMNGIWEEACPELTCEVTNKACLLSVLKSTTVFLLKIVKLYIDRMEISLCYSNT